MWHKAVEEFNDRFKVPFIVSVSDEDKDKILMNWLKLQSLEYKFCQECSADANRICDHDEADMVMVNESKLVSENEDSILRQDERRAFYL